MNHTGTGPLLPCTVVGSTSEGEFIHGDFGDVDEAL